MAQKQEKSPAGTGTQQSNTPVWDGYSGEMLPFLNLKEEQKRAGFRIQFLSDKPRKETPNNFDPKETDFWFDVVYEGGLHTWTISQKSLVMELRKYKPLKNKVFDIKLGPVDEEFKEQFPRYKGKDRYEVTYIETKEPEIKETESTSADKDEEVEIETITE